MEIICYSESSPVEVCELIFVFQRGKDIPNVILHSQSLIRLDIFIGLCYAEYIHVDSVCFQVTNNSSISDSAVVYIAPIPCLQQYV